MKRNEVIQFRVSADEKTKLQERAKPHDVSRLIREALGLPVDLKATVDPRPFDDPENQVKVDVDLGNAALSKLVKQLEAQGKSPSEATSLARKRLGL